MVIPESVTSLGNNTFEGCKLLKTVVSCIIDPFVIDESTFPNSSTATLYVPAGTKVIYEETEGWKNFREIIESEARNTITLNVKNEKEEYLTDKVGIVWYDADGREIGTGFSINGIGDEATVYYSVILDEELGRIYREVNKQKVADGENMITVQLNRIGHVMLEGRVSAPDIDKVTMTVNVKQMLNGKYEQVYSTQTNEKGEFKVEVYDDVTDITISGEGYYEEIIHRDGFSGNGNVGTIPVYLLSGFVLAANITIQKMVADGEEEIVAWSDDLNNIEFSMTNVTKDIVYLDHTVQNGNIIIKKGVEIGDEIQLTAKSKQGVFADASTSFTIKEGANSFNLQLTELGGVDATCSNSANAGTVGYLYDNNGLLAAKGSYVGETLSLRHLMSGTYMLVSMGKSIRLGGLMKLSDLEAIGLNEGTDYAVTHVDVADGELTTVSVNDVPRLEDSRFYYTNNNTYFTTNKASVTAGNYIQLQAHVDFKPEYLDKIDDVTLVIDLPDGCQMVDNSVIVNRKAVAHTVNGNHVTITLNKEQWKNPIRFCIIPTLNKTHTITAMATFDIDGSVTQPIGTAQFEAKGLSIDVPEQTADSIITINGTAKGHSGVFIYDNDVFIGAAYSKADGSWTANCELYKPYSHSFHIIYAKIVTEDGMELTSETRQVEYEKRPVPEKVTMTYYNGWYKQNKTVEFNLLNGTTSPTSWPFYSATDFTFLADFTDNDSTVIKNVNIKVLNSDGTVRTLPATFDGKQNCWVATTNYSSARRLPQNVTVEYDLLSVSKIYDEEMEEAMNTLINNMAIEVDNAYKDCEIELTTENENSISFIATTNGYLTKEKCTITILDYEKVNTEYTGKSVYHIEDDATDACFVLKKNDDYRSSIIAWDNKNKIAFEIRTGEPTHTSFSNVHRILPFILNAAYGAAASIYEYNLRMGIINDWIRTYKSDKGRHYQYYDNMIKMLYARCPDGSYKIKDESKRNSFRAEAEQCLKNAEQYHDKFEQVLIIQQNRLQSVCTLKGLTSMAISAAGSILNGVGTVFSNAKGAIVQALGKAINNYAIRAGTTLASNGTSDALGYVVEHPEESDGNRKDITPEKMISDWYFENSPKVNEKFVQTSNSIRLSYSNCIKDEEEDEPMDEKSENKPTFPSKPATPILDPSGYVYEAVLTNRLEGVTTTCYQQENGEAVLWNAEDYSQQNPLKTDDTGFYRWDVPMGMWQVKYEKEGYETAYSDWLPVPPPQLDVNIGMRQSTPPIVKQMRGYESGITIKMSKYMRPETFENNGMNVTVTRNGMEEKGSIEMMNAEQAPLGEETYVSKVKFVPEVQFNTTDLVVVTVHKEVESYCGVQMTADHVETVKIESEVKSIVADSVVTVPYQGERELRVLVLPKDASAGRTLRVKSSSQMITSVSTEEVTIGQDGAATLTLGGELPGGAVLDFSVDGTDVSATSKVKVVMGRELVATPMANISSGETIDGGTQIILTCETEGATIYYTLDGSCPCNEETRHKYDGPITIATDAVIKAIAVCDDMDDSDIATFIYMVKIVDGAKGTDLAHRFTASYANGQLTIMGAEGASCCVYDYQGRELTRRERLSKRQIISVPKTDVYIVSVTYSDGRTVVQKVL